ncbi:MAG: GNAT family N-acetyltransferase [Myxococcota bacterium]
MSVSRELARRLYRLHEAQERMEIENLLTAGAHPALGVTLREWSDGMWAVRSRGAPNHQPGNVVCGITEETLERLPEVIDWYQKAGTTLHLNWPAESVSTVQNEFARRGLVAAEVLGWMAAPLDALSVEGPPHDIVLVSDPETLSAWMGAFCAGWKITDPGMQAVVASTMGPWPGPPSWRRYLARIDGAPAGEALLVLFGEVAYLAEASTVPRFRRRGVQRALIARRLADARASGASVVFGGVEYGDASWSNMRAMGLREAHITVTFKRPASPS